MAPIKILIVNPNTNQSMTEALRAPIESLDYNNVNPPSPTTTTTTTTNKPLTNHRPSQTTYTYLNPPTGPSSINDLPTTTLSSTHTLPHILPHLPTHHAFLIACYSPHPLVPLLKRHTAKPVMGIFEASVAAAVQLLRGGEERFGIVSTGEGWKRVLEGAVRGEVLGREGAERWFGGVECCGMRAGELEGGEGVEGRVKLAVGRLVGGEGEGRVRVVVLGCAGMVGMEGWVREVVGEGGRVVDGVRAGVGILQGLVRCGF